MHAAVILEALVDLYCGVILILFYRHSFKTVLTQRLRMIQKDRNTRDHSA